MQCFRCHRTLSQRKSKYGFYYYCPNCGNTFETEGQKNYNSQNYSSRGDCKIMVQNTVNLSAPIEVPINSKSELKEALIVIDVQNIYTNKNSELFVKGNSKIISNINKLIIKFRHENKDIIFIKHQHKKNMTDLGRMFDFAGETDETQFIEGDFETDFDKRLKVRKNDTVIIKTRYDAFEKTILQQILNEKAIEKVVICGFMTNFCCETTARTAHGKDFFVDFIVDATGTPGTETLSPKQTIKATVATLSSGFAVVKNTAELI